MALGRVAAFTKPSCGAALPFASTFLWQGLRSLCAGVLSAWVAAGLILVPRSGARVTSPPPTPLGWTPGPQSRATCRGCPGAGGRLGVQPQKAGGSSMYMALPQCDRLGLPSEGLHHMTPNLTATGGQALCPSAPPFPPHRGHGLSVWSGHEHPGGRDHTSLRGLLRQSGQGCTHADTLTVLWTQGHSTMTGSGVEG